MECNAIQIVGPNNWSFTKTNIDDMDGVKIEVIYSSLCGTDREVVSGELIYYKNGVAKYPIISGHEWCGIYNDQPVVGICILGCGHCKKCAQDKPMHCDARKEVGVINKNGAHAEYIIMPISCLIPIPEPSPKYALIEPLAVCIHALNRITIDKNARILISGYGCIGKLCRQALLLMGHDCEIYDPRYTDDLEFCDFDIILECSGSPDSLPRYMSIKGANILVFGFEYKHINPSILSSNEMSMIGTLGSTIDDFRVAIEMMKEMDPKFYDIIPLHDFGEGLKRSANGNKIIFDNQGET